MHHTGPSLPADQFHACIFSTGVMRQLRDPNFAAEKRTQRQLTTLSMVYLLFKKALITNGDFHLRLRTSFIVLSSVVITKYRDVKNYFSKL